MSYSQILYDVEDGVLTITMNRPEKLNAFTGTMMTEMIDAFDRSDADDSIRAVIVTGAGRAFCAGADLGAGGSTFDADGRADRPKGLNRDGGGLLTLRIFDSKKPVIAAINGPAVGIGVTMTLAMDIRLAADVARFGFVFARRGIVPEACSSYFLPRIVGISRALEWAYSGRVFPADEALAGGLVRSLHPKDQLLSHRTRHRARDRRQHLGDLCNADPPDDVEDAWRRPSDGSAQNRFARCVSTPGAPPMRAKASKHFSRSAPRIFPAKCRRTCPSSIPGGKNVSSNDANVHQSEFAAWPHRISHKRRLFQST